MINTNVLRPRPSLINSQRWMQSGLAALCTALITLTLASNIAYADDYHGDEQDRYQNDYQGDYDLGDTDIAVATNADPVLACFVDTAAFDFFSAPSCGVPSFRSNGLAIFEVRNRGGRSLSFEWNDARCAGPACVLPIGIGSIALSVVVTDTATGQRFYTSATATVDFDPGF